MSSLLGSVGSATVQLHLLASPEASSWVLDSGVQPLLTLQLQRKEEEEEEEEEEKEEEKDLPRIVIQHGGDHPGRRAAAALPF